MVLLKSSKGGPESTKSLKLETEECSAFIPHNTHGLCISFKIGAEGNGTTRINVSISDEDIGLLLDHLTTSLPNKDILLFLSAISRMLESQIERNNNLISEQIKELEEVKNSLKCSELSLYLLDSDDDEIDYEALGKFRRDFRHIKWNFVQTIAEIPVN